MTNVYRNKQYTHTHTHQPGEGSIICSNSCSFAKTKKPGWTAKQVVYTINHRRSMASSHLSLSPSLWPFITHFFCHAPLCPSPASSYPDTAANTASLSAVCRCNFVCCWTVWVMSLLSSTGLVLCLTEPQTGDAVLISVLEWALSGGTRARRQEEGQAGYCLGNWVPACTIAPKWADPQQLKLYITQPIKWI